MCQRNVFPRTSLEKKTMPEELKNYRGSLKANDNVERAPSIENSNSRKSSERKRMRRGRSKFYRENSNLKSKLKKSETRTEKYKKRYQVLKTKTSLLNLR